MDSPTPYLGKFPLKMFFLRASLNGKCHFRNPYLRDSVKRQGIDLESQNIYIFRIYLSLVAQISEIPKNALSHSSARMGWKCWELEWKLLCELIFTLRCAKISSLQNIPFKGFESLQRWVPLQNCSSQPSMVHWLSSSIFAYWSSVRPSRHGNIRPNLYFP